MMQETLFDEFVIAHTLGWWGKAIMVRNLPLLWVLSIGFELMEVGQPTMMLHSLSSSHGSLAGHGDPKPCGHKGGKARSGLLCITLSLLLSHQLVHMYVKHLRSFSMEFGFFVFFFFDPQSIIPSFQPLLPSFPCVFSYVEGTGPV
jgi:hypothetical protein